MCLLPNAVIEVWTKLYNPAVFQTLQHIPPELVAAREAAEVQAVKDAVALHEAEAAAAVAAVATAKANKRRARGGSDVNAGVEMQPMSQPSAQPSTLAAAASPTVFPSANPASSSAASATTASPMATNEAQL